MSGTQFTCFTGIKVQILTLLLPPLLDMFVSLHTGVYVSSGNGHHRLIDDLPSIRKHYLASRQFVCDVFGVLPLRMSGTQFTCFSGTKVHILTQSVACQPA